MRVVLNIRRINNTKEKFMNLMKFTVIAIRLVMIMGVLAMPCTAAVWMLDVLIFGEQAHFITRGMVLCLYVYLTISNIIGFRLLTSLAHLSMERESARKEKYFK